MLVFLYGQTAEVQIFALYNSIYACNYEMSEKDRLYSKRYLPSTDDDGLATAYKTFFRLAAADIFKYGASQIPISRLKKCNTEKEHENLTLKQSGF